MDNDMYLIRKYRNGNYYVKLYSNGTKVRYGNGDFVPEIPESIDLKITNECDLRCPFCHENSVIGGGHADLNQAFIDALPYGIELAIGGGNPLSHPNLEDLLLKLKDRMVVSNITINQIHLNHYINRLVELQARDLIHGIGVSLMLPTHGLVDNLGKLKNTVVHTIAGVTPVDQYYRLADLGIRKILILGYKKYGRGNKCYSDIVEQKISQLRDDFSKIRSRFDIISFDNLGLSQMSFVRNTTNAEEWDLLYMGDEGDYTMYIDLVKGEFAKNSISDIRYPITDNIQDMFKVIRGDRNG